MTATSRTGTVVAQAPDEVNYIRNSVKATVDAYDGTVTLYEWDQSDPVLKAWRKAFPDTVQDREEISDELLQHCATPRTCSRCSVSCCRATTSPTRRRTTAGRTSGRCRPTRRSAPGDQDQPPYYLTLQMPGSRAAGVLVDVDVHAGGTTAAVSVHGGQC